MHAEAEAYLGKRHLLARRSHSRTSSAGHSFRFARPAQWSPKLNPVEQNHLDIFQNSLLVHMTAAPQCGRVMYHAGEHLRAPGSMPWPRCLPAGQWPSVVAASCC